MEETTITKEELGGKFGIGGGTSSMLDVCGGGGGGGWFGGAGGCIGRYKSTWYASGGSGGSSYIGGVQNGSTTAGQWSGNGKARITLIE